MKHLREAKKRHVKHRKAHRTRISPEEKLHYKHKLARDKYEYDLY